jgi:plastocyanin
MEKKMQPILIGAALILAVVVIYLLIARGGGKEKVDGDDSRNIAPVAGNPAALVGDRQGSDAPAVAPAGNMITAQAPAALTDEQKAQLKAGVDTHTPSELTFNVTGGSFYYTPNEIRVKQGDKVNIVFTNAGGTHNLNLDDFKVATKTIKTGESDVIEFTADKKGAFEFYCSVGNGYHRQQGQTGVLLVE